MDTKWTKGPWKLKIRWGSGDETKDVTVAEIDAADGPYRGGIAHLQSAEHIDGIAREELIANAHLLFASSDLYAALNAAVKQLEDHGFDGLSCGGYAALAKARGEA